MEVKLQQSTVEQSQLQLQIANLEALTQKLTQLVNESEA